jgi:predicted RecB family nuclease
LGRFLLVPVRTLSLPFVTPLEIEGFSQRTMKLVSGALRLSPTDLANYAACPHLTILDIGAARGELTAPSAFSHVTEALRKRGEAHEVAYLDLLQATGLEIENLAALPLDATGAASTLEAMERGVQVIVQAPLLQQGWAGRADVLQRIESPSALGDWSYEPLDTKLARETRGSAILQLCAYAAALHDLQELEPEHLHVVSPGLPFTTRTFRHSDYAAYYRLLRRQLEARVESPTPVFTYPDPVTHCEICRWSNHCDARRRKDDHLSLVANIRTLQIGQLQAWGVRTLEGLGNAPVPFPRKPERGTLDGLHRAREQARVQLEGRQNSTLVYELLPLQEGTGLSRLPEPSPGDIFFDIEGDPFVPPDGREYLFGYVYVDEGEPVYTPVWALTPSEEKAAFEGFVDFVMACSRRHPAFHIYHYAPYEPGAMKRLMGRYATREDEVDSMLRAEVFVDLYGIVRQGIRASVERYSIKTMEPFYEFARQIPLAVAGQHLHTVEMLLEFGGADQVPPDSKLGVEQYNEDDCVSASELRDWLEILRAGAIADGHPIARPVFKAPGPSEALTQHQAEVRGLMDRLSAGLPVAGEERSPEQQAMWLLAQLLEFHRREDKAVWWDYFRLAGMPVEDYADEPSALAGLQFLARVGGTDKAPIHRYTFPPQEFKSPDDEVHYGKDAKLGTVEDCDIETRTIDIKKRVKTANVHPGNVFFFGFVRTGVIQDALFELATWVAEHGLAGAGPHRAVRSLLLAEPPRLTQGCEWRRDGEITETRARRLTLGLDESVLPVQGPPGSGKTYVGAQMICELVRHGRSVGVTGNSHKVIRNLLDKVVEAAGREGMDVRCIQKVSQVTSTTPGPIVETDDNDAVLPALQSRHAHVAAGTAWLWSRPDLRAAVDVLVVDEAGQMVLANVAAIGMAARNLVLLGDPQQLEQPLKGSHPEGTAVSALHHLLGGHLTMPEDRGIFLNETWRLAPAVCRFTSELFYEGRLVSRGGLDVQQLQGPSFTGAGLWYLPVEHTGNQNHSAEEAEAVITLARDLVANHTWTDQKGVARPVAWNDVLIVAPYNSQVYALQERLPSARVGTVDRFQGQEAAVVIYSATTSSPEDAPRGMEFLYSLNRLNVATSRARCAVFLVASPKLFEPACQTPRQMQLANALCRYLEMAHVSPRVTTH